MKQLRIAFLMWREQRLWRQLLAASSGSFRETQIRLKWRKVSRALLSLGVHYAR